MEKIEFLGENILFHQQNLRQNAKKLSEINYIPKTREEENYFPQTGKLRSFEYKSLPYENKIEIGRAHV